ncbi:MAG: FmdB family transcriptional regulator [Burkholderiaceae bacterium]|nr:FmdB family transcriptional regulator [Burkholderiaceae bacterium]
MPIYSYRCESCSLAKDVLQKLSDPPLTQCPSCGGAFRKQLTAAGIHVEGSASTGFSSAASPCACCPAAGSGSCG